MPKARHEIVTSIVTTGSAAISSHISQSSHRVGVPWLRISWVLAPQIQVGDRAVCPTWNL